MSLTSHLYPLSKVKSSKNIRFFTQAVLPGSYCPMRTGTNIAEDIAGMSYLMVGMPECAIYSRSSTTRPEGPNGELHWMYVLDQNEVVFGCKQGLGDAIRKMDEAGAKAILLVATCVTDLIGEDIEGLIAEIGPQIHAKLSYIIVGQFRNFSYQIGTWKVMAALSRFAQRREKVPGRVLAILIEPWRYGTEAMEMPPIIKALEEEGIDVRKLCAGTTLEEYENSPSASVCLNLTTYSQPFADMLTEEHGVENIGLHLLFSVAEIDEAYEKIEEALAVHIAGKFAEVRAEAIALEARVREEMAGKKFIFMRGVDMPVPLAAYLASLGMAPMLLQIEDILPQDMPFIHRLNELGYDPPACRFMNMDYDIELLAGMGADIYFGQLPDPREDIVVMEEMYDFFGKVGYERTVKLLSRMLSDYERQKEATVVHGAQSL